MEDWDEDVLKNWDEDVLKNWDEDEEEIKKRWEQAAKNSPKWKKMVVITRTIKPFQPLKRDGDSKY